MFHSKPALIPTVQTNSNQKCFAMFFFSEEGLLLIPSYPFFFQGFCLSFLTQLDRSSHPSVKTLIKQHILGHVNATGLLNQPLPKPRDSGEYKQFEGYWVTVGGREPVVSSDYVLTASVKANLQDLARVVSGR